MLQQYIGHHNQFGFDAKSPEFSANQNPLYATSVISIRWYTDQSADGFVVDIGVELYYAYYVSTLVQVPNADLVFCHWP